MKIYKSETTTTTIRVRVLSLMRKHALTEAQANAIAALL